MDSTAQHFLITGGAAGIGLATARLLRQRGAEVTLWDMDGQALEKAAASLSAHYDVVNVTDADAVAAAMGRITHLDGVIHCAGIMRTGLFINVPVEQHRQVIDVNLNGTIYVAHAALPLLMRSKGALVLMASVSGYYGTPEYSTYAASKAAVLSFAQALQIEMEGTGVYVGVVAPHFVNTGLYRDHATQTALSKGQKLFVELKTPEQIAQSIANGLRQRPFWIRTGWRTSMVFYLTRYAHFAAHRLMGRTYRQAGGQSVRA